MKRLFTSILALLAILTIPGSHRNNLPNTDQIYAEFIQNHPFSTRPHLTKEDLKGTPKRDRPDLAMEQDFLLTMDPALGRPTPERLTPIYKQISNLLNSATPLPGSASHPWVERGPDNVGGRTRAIMFDPNDTTNKKVWAGGTTGGLWYNIDFTNPTSGWQAVNDFWDNISITNIAYDPTNTQTFYVSTGEGWGSSVSGARGAGIWKSTDAGLTWSQLPATAHYAFVNDLVVRNENGVGVVYAGLRGISYTGTLHGVADEGLQRSVDGGSTFTQVLPNVPIRSYNYAVGDIEIGANNRIWVGTIRSANSGGNRGGGTILSSHDGINWTTDYENSSAGRVKLATAPSDSNRVYAIFEVSNSVGEMKKTTDGGANWTTVIQPDDADPNIQSSDFARNQAWTHLSLAVDPNNADNVYAGGIDLFRSTNAGGTWDQLSHWYGGFGFIEVHADQQIIAFRPGSSTEALFGNDGGVFRSNTLLNPVPSFTNLNQDYNVTQFYACATHPDANSNYYLAGSQDNGSHQFISSGVNSTREVTGGDGAYCFIDEDDPDFQITSYVYNSYWLSTDGGLTFPSRMQNTSSQGSFINPTDYDSHQNVLYSTRSASSINRISNVTGTPVIDFFNILGMGGKATHIRVSPLTTTSTTLFVGTSAGRVFRVDSANSSQPNYTRISPPGSIPNGSISCIDVGATEQELLVTYTNYGIVSVWYTNDGGANWVDKEGNLPDMPIRWCMFNPFNYNEAILATEVGVWASKNLGDTSPSWTPSTSGLANVRTSMLRMRKSDNQVIAATFGRGLFSSDGFTASFSPTAKFETSTNVLCPGDTLKLTDKTLFKPTQWNWTINPTTFNFVNGTNAQSAEPEVVFTQTANYQIKLEASNANGLDTVSTSLSADVFGDPQVTVDYGLNQLACWPIAPNYEWFFNGAAIPGSTGKQFIPFSQNGTYKVEVNGINCSAVSPDFIMNNVGLTENKAAGLAVYPNPVTKHVTLQGFSEGEPLLVQLYNITGRLVWQQKLNFSNSKPQVNLESLKKGEYLLKVKGTANHLEQKVVKH